MNVSCILKDDCYISVISNLEKEVLFLRELVKEKNKLLSSFIQSSVNREQHKSPSQQNINNWKSVDVQKLMSKVLMILLKLTQLVQ